VIHTIVAPFKFFAEKLKGEYKVSSVKHVNRTVHLQSTMGNSSSTHVVVAVSGETRLEVWFKEHNVKILTVVDPKTVTDDRFTHDGIVQRRNCSVAPIGGHHAMARADPDTIFDKCKELLDTNRPLIASGVYTKDHLLADLQELYEFGPTLLAKIYKWATCIVDWLIGRITSAFLGLPAPAPHLRIKA
jgi:hypothetical protein